MNYLPFSKLTVGAMFEHPEHSGLKLMKTSSLNQAMVLESIWMDNQLYPRGTLVPVTSNECVQLLSDEDAVLEMPVVRKDPVDPRRKFWKQGDTRTVGRDAHARINVFAGLFLYSGFGMGTYFSATAMEEVWCDGSKAKQFADAEGVLFVHFDSKDWTRDPDLKFEKEQALQRKTRLQEAIPA